MQKCRIQLPLYKGIGNTPSKNSTCTRTPRTVLYSHIMRAFCSESRRNAEPRGLCNCLARKNFLHLYLINMFLLSLLDSAALPRCWAPLEKIIDLSAYGIMKFCHRGYLCIPVSLAKQILIQINEHNVTRIFIQLLIF